MRQVGGSHGTVTEFINITQPLVPNFTVVNSPSPGMGISYGNFYQLLIKKGANALKPFDTGRVLLGHHVNVLGTNIGGLIFVRIKGNLTLLCPTPKVNIVAANGGSVGFGTVSPQRMNAGDAVSKSFNLNMAVTPDCETGLNISVRFEPNNNTVLDDKYLDMDNGLQVLLNNSTDDINYNQTYFVGDLQPNMPINLPYTATLSKIPDRTITSGPFSKTIRVVVSY